MMSEMHAVNTLSMQPINSQHQQRQTTISTATEAIDQLTCQLVQKLNERSTALANGANFDLALRDAAVMQAISSTSSLGYLRAGDIYQQQRRQQEAAGMYEKGLMNAPSSDPCYTNLLLQQEDAATKASKRIDFISQLHFDLVVSEILPLVFQDFRLAADKRCPYLYVSRTWRQRILHCNNLYFHNHESMSHSVSQMREVERFSAHVKTLSIEAGRTVCYEDPMLIFDYCHFPSLTNLSIMYYGYEEYDVISALESVHQTLTHLDLYTEDSLTPGIHLGRVLDVCPNLESLELTAMTMHPLTVQHTKLTHLTLCIGVEPLSDNTMTNMLSHLPSLVFFDTFFVPDTQFLPNIRKYCPHMKLLKCGGYDTFHHNNYDRHVQGLQKLALGFEDSERVHNAGDLIPLLREHHSSLDQILLRGRITGQSVTLDGPSMEFNRLEELDVDAANDELATLALSIIRRSPRLRHVTLSHHAASRRDICNALKEVSTLGMLSARKMAPDSRWFRDLLEHHIQIGKDSPLKELKIALDAHLSPLSWMHVIGGLQTLEKLVISTARKFESPSDYFSTIATITKGCPSLSYLELHCGRYPAPEGFISQINDHPTLESLCIRASCIVVRDVVQLLSFTNLKHVIIIAPVEDYLIDLLKMHIVKVEHKRY